MSTTMVSHLNEAAAMLVLWELNFFLLSTLSWVAINLHSCSPRKWKRSLGLSSFYILFAQCTGYGIIERFSYDLEMKTREQNRNNKRKKIERTAFWLVYRTDTKGRSHGFWLVKRRVKKLHARELSRNQPILRFDVMQQHDLPSNNVFPILGFSLGGKRGGHVLIFSSTGW